MRIYVHQREFHRDRAHCVTPASHRPAPRMACAAAWRADATVRLPVGAGGGGCGTAARSGKRCRQYGIQDRNSYRASRALAAPSHQSRRAAPPVYFTTFWPFTSRC